MASNFKHLSKVAALWCILWLGGIAAAEPSRHWKMEDFGGVLSVGLEGHRSFAEGRKSFQTGCAKCHKMMTLGGGDAVDLTRLCLAYTPEELLGHLLDAGKHPPKPNGPIDFLSQAGVLDLLAFVLSGADAKSPFFFNP